MSFWATSDNKAINSDGKFESGGGDLTPIPDGTKVLAAPDEAKWDNYEGDYYVSLRWVVLKPAEFKNRKIYQKIRVEDPNKDKADKAKRMLAAIDANAGGKLVRSQSKPSDTELSMALCNKPMVLKLKVWELDDKSKAGNWIAAVSPRGDAPADQSAPEPVPAPAIEEDIDDVPF
jgi:hypothetical protein